MIGEGEAAKPWYEGIAEPEIKEYMKAKNYANPYEAARAAWSANKMVTVQADVQAFLDGKATPEQEAAVFQRMGRPPSADKYDLKFGDTADEGLSKLGKEIFFELGANPAKAQKAVDKYNQFVLAHAASQQEAERVENETALKAIETKWGPELEAHKAAGKRYVEAAMAKGVVSKELMEKLDNSIGVAAVVELFAGLGKLSDEPGLKGGGTGADPNDVSTMTPEAAKSKIDTLKGDAEFQKKYTDKNHPEHKSALALMEQLYAKAK